MKLLRSLLVLLVAATGLFAQTPSPCAGMPTHPQLQAALGSAVKAETSGLDLHMWASIVNRQGVTCAVAYSGVDAGAQWPGSRVISVQKANTANAFSLDNTSRSAESGAAKGLALSTANLYSAVQPGGSLFGLQESNPVNPSYAYGGNTANFGTPTDPMKGNPVGGVNVFGGGLALYGPGQKLIGAIGASGDTSCADHRIAWRVRNLLSLDHMAGVGGVSGDAERPDDIVFDIESGASKGGFGHPKCLNTADASAKLPAVQK